MFRNTNVDRKVNERNAAVIGMAVIFLGHVLNVKNVHVTTL